MALPYQHRVDHTPVWISPRDTAWDMERLHKEEAAIADPQQVTPWQTYEEHPLIRFWAGSTRGDLATVKEYLLPDATPTTFVLRRLPLESWAAVEQLRERGQLVLSRIACIRFGVVSIEGLVEGQYPKALKALAKGDGPTGGVGSQEIEAIKELLGDGGFNTLANAIYLASCSIAGNGNELFK
jgi:hypothetical protein